MERFKDLFEAKTVTIDVDYYCDEPKECAKMAKKYKVKVKEGDGTADITGAPKNLIAWLGASGYEDIEVLYPELY